MDLFVIIIAITIVIITVIGITIVIIIVVEFVTMIVIVSLSWSSLWGAKMCEGSRKVRRDRMRTLASEPYVALPMGHESV